MKEFIDKITIMLLSVFVLIKIYDNSSIVPAVFILITTAALMSYLRILNKYGKRINIGLEYVFGIIAVFVPESIVLVPVVSYDVFLDRQIPAGVILASGLIRTFFVHETFSMLLLSATAGLSVFLSFRTEKMEKLILENRKIRDEGEIKREQLDDKNKKLLEEQDKNINMAQLAERNRIAREIHDNVGHMLSRSILQVGAMMVVHKDGPMHEQLTGLRATLDTAMNNIRTSVHDLRDESINLETAVNEMAAPLKNRYTVSIEIDADTKTVDKEVKYACINILKEAVSNIIKYSTSEYVDIRFDEHPSMYTLVVHDYTSLEAPESDDLNQGVSRKNKRTELPHYTGNGMGLENIRQRAEQLGGQANFSGENGFRVFVRIPKHT